jgi:hypothetical protein
MGLLDEAIREHLELKRRRGADPAEVAREQREALDPISAPAPAAAAMDDPAEVAVVDDLPTEEHALEQGAADPELTDAAAAEGLAEWDPPAPGGSGRLSQPEETAELDMSTVLDDDPSPHARPGAGADGDASHAPSVDQPTQSGRTSAEGATGSESF